MSRADDLVLLGILSELRYPRMDVARIIGREKMKGSKLIRSFVTETRREVVAEAVEIRFGEEAGSAVLPLLERIEDAERLRQPRRVPHRPGRPSPGR